MLHVSIIIVQYSCQRESHIIIACFDRLSKKGNKTRRIVCLFLLSEERLLRLRGLDFGGGGGSKLGSGPVELGLGKSVSQSVLVLGPVLAKISSSLGVEFSVIFEDTGLGDISLVVIGLFLLFLSAEILVLLGGQAIRDVRLSLFDVTNTQL